jgi:DNA helicase-2/ATP-dependent DNA helicase PcrA
LVFSNRKILGLGDIVKGHPKDLFDSILRTFNLATEELVLPDRLAQWCLESGACCDKKESDLWKERHAISEAYRRYCDMCLQKNLVDFAFLQRYALDLLQGTHEILISLKQRYQYVLVDEYQDTNAVQERLFGLLAGNGSRLSVVGDDDQSVYRFRGATVRNIQEFSKRYPGTRVVKLEHNFRSRRPIVDHSQQVIIHNPARYPKDLTAVRGAGSEVLLVYEHTAAEEAASVVQLIARLRQAGRIASYSDAVILLRSVKSYASPYIEALEKMGVPCQVIGDASLFQKDEIAQLYDLFNFLGTTKEWGDKYVRHPLVGLSEVTCQTLKNYKDSLIKISDEEGLSAIEICDRADRLKLHKLLDLKRKVLAQKHMSALQVFYNLLEATGCLGRFELAGNAAALENLGIFSQLVAAWDEHGSTRNFYPFREYLELIKEGGVDPAILPLENAVQIMTIHQAKGLEFPLVVVGAVMDGRLPSQRRHDPYEIPDHLRASQGVEPGVDDPHHVDERKLFYVAATRARDLLIIGTADVVNKRGGGPSPYVHEMFGDDLKAAAKYSVDKVKDIESRRAADQSPRPRHSFSQLAYYLQCPLRYKYAVVYGLAVPWMDPVDYGANVHRCLEAIHLRAINGVITTLEELSTLVLENGLSAPRSTPEQEESFKKAAVQQLRRYLESDGNRLLEAKQAETYFSNAIGQHIMLGKVDLIRQIPPTGFEIVDFKTMPSNQEEIAQAKLQLSIYSLGIESVLGQLVTRQTAHFLGNGHAVSWDWDEAGKTETQTYLADLLGHIEQKEFAPRLSYCSRCDEFANVCPYGQKRGER